MLIKNVLEYVFSKIFPANRQMKFLADIITGKDRSKTLQILFPDQLDQSKLDFSLESLHEVDGFQYSVSPRLILIRLK